VGYEGFMLSKQELAVELSKKANTLRGDVINMIYYAGSGHPGGALSAIDILTALYFCVMRIDPQNPKWEDRDRFILSKGHSCPALYAVLAEKGYFPKSELATLRKVGSILQGHPDMKKTPGVDMTTGSLGHGLSVGVGMALGAKMDKKNYRVFVMLGDGEIQEGQIWEAAMVASHHRLDNLIAILDYNNLQVDGVTNEIVRIEPVADKWRSFGWEVLEIDGHDMTQILVAFTEADRIKGEPCIIIANTIKGKGVSFMENAVDWHSRAPTKEEMKRALRELERRGN